MRPLNKCVHFYLTTSFREALKECTRERVPLDWAGTQNNLGNALRILGERDSGTKLLEEAVSAYREALKEITRERVPLYWAMTQNNLGIALYFLGTRKNDIDVLKQAQDAIQESYDVYKSAGYSHYYGSYEKRLQEIKSLIETLTKESKKMTPELIKIAGQIAGIGGLSLMVFYFLFKDIIRKSIFPKLKEENAYRLLRQIVWLIFFVTIAGMGSWIFGTYASSKLSPQPQPVVKEPSTVTNTGENTGVISNGDISVGGDLVVGGAGKTDKN